MSRTRTTTAPTILGQFRFKTIIEYFLLLFFLLFSLVLVLFVLLF